MDDDIRKVVDKINDNVSEESMLFTLEGENKDRLDIDWISSGLISFDLAVQTDEGPGGFPRGRVIEIYGPEKAGKSSLAISGMAEAQKQGIQCAYFDNENGYNPHFAEKLGVDNEKVIFGQNEMGETSLDAIEALVVSGEVGYIVVDSIAGFATKEELTSNMDDKQMADRARMWSKAMRKLKGKLNRNNCALVLVNQLRENVGQMFGNYAA